MRRRAAFLLFCLAVVACDGRGHHHRGLLPSPLPTPTPCLEDGEEKNSRPDCGRPENCGEESRDRHSFKCPDDPGDPEDR